MKYKDLFSLKKKKKKNVYITRLLQILLGALRIKSMDGEFCFELLIHLVLVTLLTIHN